VRDGRRGFAKNVGVFLIPVVLLSLLVGFGCSPKIIHTREEVPAVTAREEIVRYAVTLLGKPYKNAAKGPEAFDCSGFVYHVYGRFDVVLPVSTEGLNRTGYEIERSGVSVADLVVFRIKRDYHVGIMVNDVEFIHASKSRGVAIDNVNAPYWKRSFSQFRRVF
jgi:cell wall-associated NlpC family hydrolase